MTMVMQSVLMKLRIRELRKQRGWTIEHLAALAGMSRTHLNNIELGSKIPNARRLASLAAALEVDVGALFSTTKPDADREVIELFHRLPDYEQEAWLNLLRAAAKRASAEEEPSSSRRRRSNS